MTSDQVENRARFAMKKSAKRKRTAAINVVKEREEVQFRIYLVDVTNFQQRIVSYSISNIIIKDSL